MSQALRNVNIVSGLRTPFLKSQGVPGPFSASAMAVRAGRELFTSLDLDPQIVDEVIVGCMIPSPDEANIGRLIGLRLGCGNHTPGWTVQRNCASGMQALDSALKDIQLGRAEMVLAGGTETMSRAPLILSADMVRWLSAFNRAKTLYKKFAMLTKLKPKYLKPIISLIHGLSDPLCGMNMGQTAELVAHEFNIDRHDLDAYALRSQQRLAKAIHDGIFDDEITTIYSGDGKYYPFDNGVRADSTLEKLATLKPTFEKYGIVTAGNSSQISDGACMLLLASDEAVKQHKLNVLGRITDVGWGALDPRVMSLGPLYATAPIINRHKFTVNDIDYWEINEAFAATVLGCVRAWQSADYCKDNLGMAQAFGKLDEDKLNIDGGAIATGHPVGATGARLVLHVLNVLKRKKLKRGIATLCIGGGQGGAMLLERD